MASLMLGMWLLASVIACPKEHHHHATSHLLHDILSDPGSEELRKSSSRRNGVQALLQENLGTILVSYVDCGQISVGRKLVKKVCACFK